MPHRTSAALTVVVMGLTLSQGIRGAAESEEPTRRALFVSGQGGYPRVRIPALLLTQRSALLAFSGGWKGHVSNRNNLSSTGEVDMLLRRSFDGGKTWEPIQVLKGQEDTESWCNYCPVIDHRTGTIWVLFNKNNQQCYAMNSSDEGDTWSKPLEITAKVTDPSWAHIGFGPLRGIQLRSGRLVVPTWITYQDWSPADSMVVYSDDHGRTWKHSATVQKGFGDECTVVELADNSLYMSIRAAGPGHNNRRGAAQSRDGGETWTTVRRVDALRGRSTQGSLTRYTTVQEQDKNRVLLTMPAGSNERYDLTVFLSYDECQSWPVWKLLHKGPSAYSDLTVLPDGRIACLYEGGREFKYESVIFTTFTIRWLTNGKDSGQLQRESQ